MTHEEYVKQQYEGNKIDYKASFVEAAEHNAQFYAQNTFQEANSILDVGCRTGYTLEVFLQMLPQAEITGCDLVPEFVEAARVKVGDRAQVDVANAHHLPYEDGEFEWVFASHVLEHCHDLDRAWKEVKRVAQVGVAIVVPMGEANTCEYTSCHNAREWIKRLDLYAHDVEMLVVKHKQLFVVVRVGGGE